MLNGFRDDAEDQTGWLAGVSLWASGAFAGLLMALAVRAPALSQFEVLGIALFVSTVSICLRLPVVLSHRPFPTSLGHALWLLGAFAQLNWSGFLATRASSGLVAAEAFIICIAAEAWLFSLLFRHNKLEWLSELRKAWIREFTGNANGPEHTPSSLPITRNEASLDDDNVCHSVAQVEFQRVTRDSVDENGVRFLSGTVRFEMSANQRTEIIVICFHPVLSPQAEVELETDSEEITARVEHATESGARIAVRRQKAAQSETFTLEWFAKASSETVPLESLALP